MNGFTAVTIINVALIAVIAFAVYLTESGVPLWALLLLLKYDDKGDD